MSYLRTLTQLREKMAQRASGGGEETSSLVPMRYSQQEAPAPVEDILSRSASWLSQIKEGAYQIRDSAPQPETSGSSKLIDAVASAITSRKKPPEEEARENSFIQRRKDSSPSKYAPERPKEKAERNVDVSSEPSDKAPVGYGDISQKTMEAIIRSEAQQRNIDPDVAVAIFRSEGAGSYQSQVKRSGKGSYGGKEDSYGPYQLYRGGGLGNEYESLTGRNLRQDNTVEGVTNQIRFALDRAVKQGWTPWYGRKTAGVGVRDGLSNAKALGNWK